MRRNYIERIFEALRILYLRPNVQNYPNTLANIDRDRLNLMDTERSAMLFYMWPCDECDDIPAEILLQQLRRFLPWFTNPSSYLGSVEGLLPLLLKVECSVRTIGNTPGSCNQLKHLWAKLLERIKK